VRLSNAKLNALNKFLLETGQFIISEFARKPISLIHIDRRKAIEMSFHTLYWTSHIKIIFDPEDFYNHFLAFSIALHILADPKLCHEMHIRN